MKSHFAIVLAVALLSPACAATRAYTGGPAAYGSVRSAFDEGFRQGRSDGSWAARRDRRKGYRNSFWDDGRYRAATNGYRPQFGSKFEYSEGFRAGYEQAYFEQRGWGRD